MNDPNTEKAKECVDQTIEGLQSIIKDKPRSNLKQVIQNAIFALDKQKPKKPIDLVCDGGFGDRAESCPSCKNHIVNVWNRKDYKPHFCHCCGQRFDWNDDEK